MAKVTQTGRDNLSGVQPRNKDHEDPSLKHTMQHQYSEFLINFIYYIFYLLHLAPLVLVVWPLLSGAGAVEKL
jgi:hypothetical protein